MADKQFTGPGGGVVKYDLLTALGVHGLNSPAAEQISMARLSALITARYNWRTEELVMGQAEMARLWGIGERTVKREVKRWLSSGLLICRQPGVRGRVARYRLNIARLCELTEPVWALIGPDFEARMTALKPNTAQVIRLDVTRQTVSRPHDSDGWEAVSARLADRFPSQHAAWIAPLRAHVSEDTLTLEAKSAFAAEYAATHFGRDITEAVAAEWGAEMRVVLRGPVSAGRSG